MPRGKKKIKKRQIAPDPKYNSVLVAKFINYVMRKGKKLKAQNIVYKAFEEIKKKTKKDPLKVFEQAVENASPKLEVRPRRVGGATYQVPFEVPEYRGKSLAMRWMIEIARERQGKPMYQFLAEEIMLAANNEGSAVKRKEDLHKLAQANRAFAHYARL